MTSIVNHLNSFFYNPQPLENRKNKDENFLETLQTHEKTKNRIKELSDKKTEKYARIKELDPSFEIPNEAVEVREEREERLLKMVRTLAPKWSFDEKNIFLQVDEGFYCGAKSRQVTERGGVILVYPFFLLESSDLVDFQVSGLEDPKLFDDRFLEKAKSHIEKILDIKKPDEFAIFNKKDFSLFLYLIQKPEQWEEAKRFILSHELEHLYLKHQYKDLENNRPAEKIAACSVSAASLGYLHLIQYSLPISLLWAAAAGMTAKWALTKWNKSYEIHSQELEADRGAVKKLQNMEGLEYIMKSKIEFNKASRKVSIFFSALNSSQGESFWDKLGGYPSCRERLINAEKALASKNEF